MRATQSATELRREDDRERTPEDRLREVLRVSTTMLRLAQAPRK
jgi:hypothetical protein